jgi:hypothetical protein
VVITALALAAGPAALILTQPDRTVIPAIEVKPALPAIEVKPAVDDSTKVKTKKKAEGPAKQKARARKPRASGSPARATGSSGGSGPTLSPVVPAGGNEDEAEVGGDDRGGDDGGGDD